MEAPFPDSTSPYAEEGTFAHKVGEHLLQRELGLPLEHADVPAIPGHDQWHSQELVDYVRVYIELAMSIVAEARSRTPDALVMLEKRVDFSPWVPRGFGTGDLIVVADGVVDVVDLKYGKGVHVTAANNPQLRLYGLGAVNELAHLYDIKRVRMTICQPRVSTDHSTEELPVEELLDWARTQVAPAAQAAWSGQGELVAGDHCGFCKARFQCPAREQHAMVLAQQDFALKTPDLLTPEQVVAVLERAKAVEDWISDVREFALRQALNGAEIPGWKLVEGRSNRKYVDEAAVANRLLQHGLPEAALYERSLLPITRMEAMLGKKKFASVLSGLVVKPEGKPTLAPVVDKRPAFSPSSALEDFTSQE